MDFLEKILQAKKQEVSRMPLEEQQALRKTQSFYQQVKNSPEHMHIIGEVKRASPYKGDINLAIDVIEQANMYESSGVTAISVLTDPIFFKGSIEDLRQVAQSVQVPILCKDFIIDEKQIVRARNAGATIILLIISVLSKNELKKLYDFAKNLDLEVLVEVHDRQELNIAEGLGAELIGVNNRNLKTFDISVETSLALGDHHTTKAVYISESGICEYSQVQRLKKDYQAILVGEGLMKAQNPQDKIIELKVQR